MIDTKKLFEQFLGSQAGGSVQGAAGKARGMLDQVAARTPGGMTGLAAGAGVLALLLGGKKARKLAGGAVGLGGAAALGALAYRAWQNSQANASVSPAPMPPPALPAPDAVPAAFQPAALTGPGGEPFELSLMRAMISAAKADGHIDGEEHGRIFAAVDRLGLDAEAKGFVFDALNAPADPARIAGAATGPEQAAQLYLASRMAIDPDHPGERAYLDALAHQLGLAPELRRQLDAQVAPV